jgi:hypothetical protein
VRSWCRPAEDQNRGDDRTIVDAGWGRSGKRAIITVADPHYHDPKQVVLTVEQAAALGRFLMACPEPTG